MLNELPYVDMIDDVVTILHERAKNEKSFYEILYAFHVFRGNYGKAAQCMYEFGKSLDEDLSIPNLEKQLNCYLSTLNALQLVNDKWILYPNKETSIVTYKEIEMEYLITKSRLLLASKNRKLLNLSPNEIYSLLIQEGYFDVAFSFGNLFNFEKKTIFENLVYKCLFNEKYVNQLKFFIKFLDLLLKRKFLIEME